MLRLTLRELRPAAVMLVAFTFLAGVVYPLVVTAVAKLAFPGEAGGSLVEVDGKVIGSELIAQSFTSPRYFWPRPSACEFNGAASSGSNLAMSNPALVEAVKERVAALRASDPADSAPIPVDLVLASGSGLDPHISVPAALWQAPRVARARRLKEADVVGLVRSLVEPRTFGVLGEPRVNVLDLNRALDSGR